jgi:hypothetical protein
VNVCAASLCHVVIPSFFVLVDLQTETASNEMTREIKLNMK